MSLPEWFIHKYTIGTALEGEKPPPPKPKLSLYRQYLNQEFAPLESEDTQQERERLPGSLLPSVRQKFDPGVLNLLASQYSPPKAEIVKEAEITTPEKKATLLTTTPIVTPPTFQEGKKVFTDQTQLEKIVAEAPEEGRTISFREAFRKARRSGLQEFEYKGDRFNTRKKGETENQWLSALGIGKPPVIAEVIPSEALTFEDYMKQAGITAAPGKEINTTAISSRLGPVLNKVVPLLKEAGITPEITAGQRDAGTWTLHAIGEAIDIRLKTATTESLSQLESSLPGNPTEVMVEGDEEKGKLWTDGTYEYIIHGTGDNIHLHIERETEESKARLVEQMIQLGQESKIPLKGLSQYPNLLKQYASKLPKVN